MDTASSVLTEAGDSLALAMIASSNAPIVLLDGELAVVAASGSFCEAFRIDPAAVAGRPLAALGEGEWGGSQLGALLKATAGGFAEIDAYEMDLERKGQVSRRLVINARKLDYLDAGETRMIMSVADVTTPGSARSSRTISCARRRSCSRSSSIGSPTACRSSPAC